MAEWRVAVAESQTSYGCRILHFLPGLEVIWILARFGKPLKCQFHRLEAKPITEVCALPGSITVYWMRQNIYTRGGSEGIGHSDRKFRVQKGDVRDYIIMSQYYFLSLISYDPRILDLQFLKLEETIRKYQ